MIRLDNVTCTRSVGKGSVAVLDDISASLPTNRRLLILGHSGSGKSTLMRLLSGALVPNSGTVTRTVRVSYPVGFQSGFEPTLSARQNIEFACHVYDADYIEVLTFVAQVAGITADLDKPLASLSRMAKIKLGYTLSYALPFDTYLIDGNTGAGDREFRERCLQMLESRSRSSGIIMTTSEARLARRLGDSGAILFNGKLYVYDDMQTALHIYESLAIPHAAARRGRDDPDDDE